MKFEIILKEEDYLTHLLFVASKSKLVKTRRRTTLALYLAASVLLSFSTYHGHNSFLNWWQILLLGVLFVFLYAFYQRYLYRKTYRKSIVEQYKGKMGSRKEIEFVDEQLFIRDYIGESRINLSKLQRIYETGAYFYLKFESSETLILPKSQIDSEELKTVLKALITRFNIPVIEQLDWKWR